ncbi:MAG: hypothetical protein WCJ93_00970 [Methanomicrobiales archaeon]
MTESERVRRKGEIAYLVVRVRERKVLCVVCYVHEGPGVLVRPDPEGHIPCIRARFNLRGPVKVRIR